MRKVIFTFSSDIFIFILNNEESLFLTYYIKYVIEEFGFSNMGYGQRLD